MVSCGAHCSKYLLLILNLIFFILGICILVVGFSSVEKFKEYEEFTVEITVENTWFMQVLIIIGFAVLTLSIFGCVGACNENPCMLITFSSILSVYILIELICIVYIFAFKFQLKDKLMTAIDGEIDKYDTTGQNQTVNRLIDDLQFKLKCCGAKSASDWNRHFKNSTIFPKSCCPIDKRKQLDCLKPYDKGCLDGLFRFLRFPVGTATVALIFQFFALIFACTLYKSIRNVKYEALK